MLKSILARQIVTCAHEDTGAMLLVIGTANTAERDLFTEWFMSQVNAELAAPDVAVPGGGKGHEGKVDA